MSKIKYSLKITLKLLSDAFKLSSDGPKFQNFLKSRSYSWDTVERVILIVWKIITQSHLNCKLYLVAETKLDIEWLVQCSILCNNLLTGASRRYLRSFIKTYTCNLLPSRATLVLNERHWRKNSADCCYCITHFSTFYPWNMTNRNSIHGWKDFIDR